MAFVYQLPQLGECACILVSSKPPNCPNNRLLILMKCSIHFFQARISRLREMFPDMSTEYLKTKLEENGDILDLTVSDILKAWDCK